MSWQSCEYHFGSAGLVHYLTECSSDQQRAMALYEWNAAISAAFWESLSYLEVALSNAIDRQMQAIHVRKGRPGHWSFDDAQELGRDARGAGGTTTHANEMTSASVSSDCATIRSGIRVRHTGRSPF